MRKSSFAYPRLGVLILLLCLLLGGMGGAVYAGGGAPGGHEDHEGHGHQKTAPADATPYLKFIENVRQWEAPVRYRTDLVGGRLWLRNTGFTYAFHDVEQLAAIHDKYYHDKTYQEGERIENEQVTLHAFHVEFLGANAAPTLSSEGESEAYYNYFVGTQDKWATGLRAMDKVHYADVYPGIGLDVYSQGAYLKYDFVLAAGADASKIRLQYEGLDGMELVEGDLKIKTAVAEMTELKPYAYQIEDGKKVEVPCRYVLEGNVLSFEFPEGYDGSKELVIDPTLVGATYSGSTSTCYGHSATYDSQANIYAAGICFGTGFPVTGGVFQQVYGGQIDQGINKYSPDATALIWSTYIGGSSGDFPHSMIVNSLDELIVLGTTGSSNFPTTPGAHDATLDGICDITVSHLNVGATAMLGSTYLGGSAEDGRISVGLNFNYGDTYRGEVIVDAADNICIASTTQSQDFPTTPGAFQGTYGGGMSDGVVVKLNPTVTTLIWSSYIGGTDEESANSLKLNTAGEIYVTGGTASTVGFPTTPGAYHTTSIGGADAYMLHINSTCTNLLQGTYLGTTGEDQGYFLEIDASGFPYVLGQGTGYTVTPGAYFHANGGLFVDKLTPNLSGSLVSTTIGGMTASLSPTAFLVDVCGNIYLSAWGNSDSLPVTPNAFQPVAQGGDFYLLVMTPNATGLLYATNFGGSGWEHVDGGTSRFDKQGIVYQSSCSSSPNWPTTPGAVYPNSTNNSYDVVCFKFEFNFINLSAAFASAQAPSGCAPFTVNFINSSSTSPTTYYLWDFGTGDTDTAMNPVYVYTSAGVYNVMLIVTDSSSCMGSDTAFLSVNITALPPLNLDQDTMFCLGDSVQISAPFVAGATYVWSPPTGLSNPNIHNPMAEPSQVTNYVITLTDSNGCVTTGDVTIDVINVLADAGPLASFCEGDGGAQLVAATPTGGMAPYYYTWWCDTSTTAFCGLDSIYDNDPLANPTATTWYYLQIQDANGCLSALDSALVEVRPKPLVDAGPDVGICQPPAPGAVITATVTNSQDAPGPYTIQWMPALGLNDPTIFSPYARPDTTTIYTAVVTSANGCTSQYTTVDTTSTITVTVHPQPIADAGPDLHSCLYDSLMIQGQGYGAGPLYEYEWSPFTGLSDSTIPNPLAAPPITHVYTLTVWSNGCPSIGDTMTMWVHTVPTPSAGNIVEVCLGDAGQLDAFGAGDSSAYYTYNWWPPLGLDNATAENPLASPDSTTWYYLEVTSSWGCVSALDSVLLRVKPTPVADAGPDLQICAGDSIQLQGGYYYTTTDSAPATEIYYGWTPNQMIGDSTQAQPWAWPQQSGWYHLDVRYNTCSTQDSALIMVIPTPVPNVGADTNVACEGVGVQLHASGGIGNVAFVWSPAAGLDDPGSANPVATPDTTTTYSVAMHEGGCIGNATVTLRVIPSPDVAYANSEARGCVPLAVSFVETANGDAIQYVWNFGDGSDPSNMSDVVHVFDRPGSYSVSLTGVNAGGCATTAQTVVVNVIDTIHADFTMRPEGQPEASAWPLEVHAPATAVDFRNLSAGGQVEWVWDFGDGVKSTDVHPRHSYTGTGTYMVTLRALNDAGCVSTAVKGPVVVVDPELFIPNVFSPNGDGNNDAFLVDYRGSQAFNLKIFDRWGALLHDTRNRLDAWEGVDAKGADTPEGVYFYQVTVGGKEYAGDVTLVR